MACVVSTKTPVVGSPPDFDLSARWLLHDKVEIRPERFGALLYHFGTRRLSFVKSPMLLQVLEGLSDSPSAAAAIADAGVPIDQARSYEVALAKLAHSQMICSAP
jgi:mycofactocin biosynthesis protein MftB